jgi:hypothetical protein
VVTGGDWVFSYFFAQSKHTIKEKRWQINVGKDIPPLCYSIAVAEVTKTLRHEA